MFVCLFLTLSVFLFCIPSSYHYSARKLYITAGPYIVKYDLETQQKTNLLQNGGAVLVDIAFYSADWLIFVGQVGGLKAIHPDGGPLVTLDGTTSGLSCTDHYSIEVMNTSE